VVLAACGGGGSAADAPLRKAELESEIRREADDLNSCDVVGDCEPKGFGCNTVYVNADSDQARLDELVSEHQSRYGDVSCDLSCPCGLLSCQQGKCTTEAGDDCSSPPEGAEVICL
jgi:hypothetical protein